MKQFDAHVKHHILLEYAPRSRGRDFAALAARHAVPGGKRTVQRWHQQWDGTPQSLQRRAVSGRPCALTAAQVSRLVRAPILAANRAHRPVHYTTLLPRVRQRTGTQVSIQTLRRYGKEQLGIKQKHTTKRTADESECIHTHARAVHACVLCMCAHSHCSVCLAV